MSEPDPDSSDDWCPTGSTASSRASSPDAPERRGRASSRGRGQDPEWHQTGWQPHKIPFTATPGPQSAAAELDSDLPADYLELFLTDELLRHIVDQTNLYARQFSEAHPDSQPHSRGNAWKPVSVPEMKTFFGLTFLTGYVKKPNLELYWSADEVDATPYFSQTMSRNRFQLIWRYLHFNDNTSQDATDRMYKVRPVLDNIVGKFKELYQPGQNICIDEGMMLWRGRLSFRVYNPQKPVKYGIKSYILCDSATGYCFNMKPYVGEGSTLPDTVFGLLDRLPGHGYTLYMDNFYNSVALCERLVAAQTNVCGTLRKNRGEPKVINEVTKSDLGAGGKIVRHSGGVMVLAWHDKRLVKMVTTCHQDRMEKVDVWQKGHRTKVPQLKPECIVAYNSCMNGVDKLDQNIAYYPFIRRSLNWSKKFVAYLFQLSMFNAHVLYKARNPGECKSHLEFIRRLVRSWTAKRHVGVEEVGEQEEEGEDVAGVGAEGGGDFEEGRGTQRAPYNTDPESRLDGLMRKHQLEHLQPTNRKSRPARRCRVCARRGQRSETKMWCKSCRVPLHAGECFTVYHTKQDYSV
ncbi:hypothetical protein AAFF_G00075650 [Aldrovandia affinis]|uniref:PiggyBac transposable element-derived protein domain-containing protein n=1 Tax=Aldrovandia affinis TaxID=143900 RepID=A0AAD7RY39_9TELE|nr:hypothetical protein AAFF_G00075650 [Aldrovandia affinis]